jgi:hypothetical protein
VAGGRSEGEGQAAKVGGGLPDNAREILLAIALPRDDTNVHKPQGEVRNALASQGSTLNFDTI